MRRSMFHGVAGVRLLPGLLLPGLLVSCRPLSLPDRAPTLVGVIVAETRPPPGAAGRPTVHVKQTPGEPCGIVFSIGSETDIVVRDPRGALSRAPFDSLTAGRIVRVWSGAVAESCPGQSRAGAIEIIVQG